MALGTGVPPRSVTEPVSERDTGAFLLAAAKLEDTASSSTAKTASIHAFLIATPSCRLSFYSLRCKPISTRSSFSTWTLTAESVGKLFRLLDLACLHGTDSAQAT